MAAIGFFLAGTTCRSDSQSEASTSAEEPIFLSYRTGGGMDIYKDEDWYGFGIDIWFDGSYALYQRVYRRGEEGKGSIQEKIVGEGQLRDEEFTSLNKGVDTLSLSSIPKRLPDVDPRKVEIRGPAETVLLSVREAPSEELIDFQVDMGADRKHYPEALLRLHERLKSLARERISEIRD